MDKELIILNDSNRMINPTTNNKLIAKINKLSITKPMKQILLIACLNLLSSVKTTKSLIYQLESFRNQGKVYPEKSKSKYINNILKDIKKMSVSDFTNNINNLIHYLDTNNINIKI